MRILFMGTPDFAQESLKCLVEANYDVIGVVTNTDKPKGRGMKMIPTPVKEYALEKDIEVYQPEKIRNNNEFIKSLSLNHGFSKILESTPRDVLNQRCYDYCEACRIIGNVFNKKGKY